MDLLGVSSAPVFFFVGGTIWGRGVNYGKPQHWSQLFPSTGSPFVLVTPSAKSSRGLLYILSPLFPRAAPPPCLFFTVQSQCPVGPAYPEAGFPQLLFDCLVTLPQLADLASAASMLGGAWRSGFLTFWLFSFSSFIFFLRFSPRRTRRAVNGVVSTLRLSSTFWVRFPVRNYLRKATLPFVYILLFLLGTKRSPHPASSPVA